MSVTVKTNVDDLNRLLRDLPEMLDLDKDRLGDELFNVIAPRIKDRFDSQRGATARFKANRGTYGKRKRSLGIPVGVGLRNGGDMAKLANFLGRRTITAKEGTLEFGVTDFARRKGIWFDNTGDDGTEQSAADGQPPRPFFEINESDVDKILDVLEQRIIERIQGF